MCVGDEYVEHVQSGPKLAQSYGGHRHGPSVAGGATTLIEALDALLQSRYAFLQLGVHSVEVLRPSHTGNLRFWKRRIHSRRRIPIDHASLS